MLTNVITMLYNNSRARKIPRQLYFSTIYNWRKNLKPQENVNIINCAQKIPDDKSVRDF